MAAFDAGQDQHLSSKDVSGSTSVESFVWGTCGMVGDQAWRYGDITAVGGSQ